MRRGGLVLRGKQQWRHTSWQGKLRRTKFQQRGVQLRTTMMTDAALGVDVLIFAGTAVELERSLRAFMVVMAVVLGYRWTLIRAIGRRRRIGKLQRQDQHQQDGEQIFHVGGLCQMDSVCGNKFRTRLADNRDRRRDAQRPHDGRDNEIRPAGTGAKHA